MLTDEYVKSKMGTIVNMDCLEFMKTVPDNYFDLVLTDPPYGINIEQSGTRFKRFGGNTWDKETPSDEIFKEMFRVSKHQIIWGGNYFSENLKSTKNWIIWDKKNPNMTFAEAELAWCSMGGSTRIYGEYSASNQDGAKVHPTQKPTQVFRYSIRYAQKQNEIKTIFDPFMGSGTTAVVAKELGIDFVGCELEADYVAIANKRLEQVQGSLF